MANANDLLIEVGTPGTATTLSAPGYAIGNTSLTVGSTTNWPTATGVIFAMDEVDSAGVRVDGTYNVYEGVVSGATSITDVAHITGSGTNRNYSAGATTRVYIVVASEITRRLVEWGLTHADQDGTLKAGAVDNAGVLASDVVTTAKILDGNVTEAKLTHRPSEYVYDHVASGCVWSGDAYGSTRVASMTSGVVYISGIRVAVSAVTSRTFTASRDTYIDVGSDGVVDYNEVTNNNTSPALASGHIRLGIITTGASNIAAATYVNQGMKNVATPVVSSNTLICSDSLGNIICPRSAQRNMLGLREIYSGTSTSATTATAITGLTLPVIIPAYSKYKATIYCYGLYNNTNTAYTQFGICTGSASDANRLVFTNMKMAAANQELGAVAIYHGENNTSSPVTVTLVGFMSCPSGGGTSTFNANGVSPLSLSVEKE